MNILIIDDEKNARELNRAILEKRFPSAVIRDAESIQSALEQIAEKRPDLLLLDIKLREGTGFEILQQVQGPSIPTIFITAYDNYALKAFRFSALNYLLKPVDSEELIESVQKVYEQREKEKIADKMEVFMQHLSAPDSKNKKITVQTTDTLHFLSISDIMYCKADGPYTYFYLKNGKHLLASKTMGEYEELLSEFSFIRTHHSYLVNVEFVTQFNRKTNSIVLTDATEIPVSSRKKEDVLKFLKQL